MFCSLACLFPKASVAFLCFPPEIMWLVMVLFFRVISSQQAPQKCLLFLTIKHSFGNPFTLECAVIPLGSVGFEVPC